MFLETPKTGFCPSEAQLSVCCHVAVGVLFWGVFFFEVPSVGLHCVIVLLPSQTHLRFVEPIYPIVHTKTQDNWPISSAEDF